MEEEDHFSQTLLPLLSHTLLHKAAGLLPLAAPLSLLVSLLHSQFLCSLSLSVPIYRQEWCHQLQLFFNKGGCQLHLFFNNGGCQSQWLVPSICCTLMATNPTKGTLLVLVDPKLGQDYNKEEVIIMINVALLCSNVSAAVRPAMSSVVSMLEGKAVVQDIDIPDKSMSTDEKKIEEMRRHFQVINEQEISETRTLSMDGPSTAASTSAGDLYPVSLDSDYLKGRE